MATKARLTTLFDGDASGVKKASKEARQAVGAFEKETSGVAGKIAGALGVDAEKFSRIGEAAKGAGVKVQQAMAAAGTATEAQIAKVEALTTAMSVGLAGAIGAVIIIWKNIKAEADFYFETVDGSIRKSGLEAYKETLRSVAMEHRGLTESASLIEDLARKWERAKQNLRNYYAEANNNGKWYDILTFGVAPLVRAKRQTGMDEMKAANAEALAERRTLAQKEMLDVSIEVEKVERQIAERMNEARLNTTETARREQIIADIQSLIQKSYDLRAEATKTIFDTTKAINELSPTSMKDYRAEKAAEMEVYRLETEMEERKSQLSRLINKNTTAIARESAETRKAAAAVREYNAAVASAIERNLGAEQLSPANASALLGTAQLGSQMDRIAQEFASREPLEIPAKLRLDGVDALIESAIDGITSAFANAMTGDEDFGTGMLKVLADMAVRVGEIAVATGLAVAGIKGALMTLQPEVAIAAGADLIAAGKWAGSALSKAAGGSGTSTSYGGSGSGYGAADFNVQISGEFSFQNGALSTAISNENIRSKYLG